MTKKKGEFTVLRNIRAGMVIILLIYIGLIFQSKGDSDTPFADVQKVVVDAALKLVVSFLISFNSSRA